MTTEERVRWFNARDPIHEWKVGQDVYCLHCDAVFKAEDVGEDSDNLPECPLCAASPLDLHTEPWWRMDLIDQKAVRDRLVNTWRVSPICAVPGQPRVMPPESHSRF